jgi:hypothetical protein
MVGQSPPPRRAVNKVIYSSGMSSKFISSTGFGRLPWLTGCSSTVRKSFASSSSSSAPVRMSNQSLGVEVEKGSFVSSRVLPRDKEMARASNGIRLEE